MRLQKKSLSSLITNFGEETFSTQAQGMDQRLLGEDANDLKRKIWEEEKKIWRVCFPAMLARVSSFGMFVITQAFIGQLGELQLAGYALVQTIGVRFVNGILLGMSSATETLCGQAFGARQYEMMGIYLQRSWIINFIAAKMLLFAFIFAARIFKLIGEEAAVADMAGYISLWFIPILFFFAFSFPTQKYLQSQQRNRIVGWISAATFVLEVLLSWIFVDILKWGIPGAMSAIIIASWLVNIVLFIYVFGGWCPDTWKGFTTSAFAGLLPITKLSISSGIMLCLEFWYTAVLVLLAGYMTDAKTQISALSICLNINAWEFMLCVGFIGATSVRVSNELGRGNAKAAKFAVKVLFCTCMFMGIFFFIVFLIFGRQIAYLFTKEEAVIEEVVGLSLLLSFSVLLNSFQAILSGAAVGCGRQSMVAYVNIISYYVIGVPIGAVLGYVCDLEIKGVWIGMQIGVVLQCLLLGYITFRTNWEEQVQKASERLNRWFIRPSEEESGLNSSHETQNE